MKISASPVKGARAARKPWRDKITLSIGVAPLGLGCALLLYILGLELSRGLGYLNQVRPSSTAPLVLKIERALVAVRASMVELPSETEARAVGQSTSNTRMAVLENQQMTAAVRKLEIQYEVLMRRYEENLARQYEKMNHTQDELRRLQKRQAAITTRVGMLVFDREYTTTSEELEDRGRYTEAGKLNQPSDLLPNITAALGKDIVNNSPTTRSWISNTGLSSEPSPRFAALQIARRLDNARRVALQSKQERTFVVDVESGLFGADPGSEPFQLDPAFELRLITASSEVINEHSGRIRFFPDGSSTGGHIHIQGDRDGATVAVAWSTGAVTVQVHGD